MVKFLTFLSVILIGIVQIEPAPYEILMLIIIFSVFSSKNINLYNMLLKYPLMIFALAFFIISNGLSLVNAVNINHGIIYFGVTGLLICSSVFWAVNSYNNTQLDKLLTCYLISTGIVLFIGFFSYLFASDYLGRFVYDETRMMSSFKDPNVFGAFLIPAFMISIWRINKNTNYWGLVIFGSLIAGGIVLSFSRGAWMSLMVSVLIFFAFSFRHKLKIYFKPLFKIAICTFLLVSAILTYSQEWDFLFSRIGLQSYDADRFNVQGKVLGESVNGLQNYDTDSVTGQEIKLEEYVLSNSGVLEDALTTKIFGIGPGQFEDRFNYAAHSLYIRTFSENGILGIIGLLAFLLLLMVNLWKKIHDKIDDYGVLLFSIIAGMLVLSLVIDTVHWRHFWLFAGLAWGHLIND